MTTARDAVHSKLMWPTRDPDTESHGVDDTTATSLCDAYRAEILREVADALDESETLRDLTDDHMHDVNAAANELRRMAAKEPTR